jgi:hypothetical protein
MIMEVYKHKKTGKYFVYIQDSGDNSALFVTPLSEIKVLKLSHFLEEEVEDGEEDYMVSNRLIEVEQVQKFHEYMGSRSEENYDNAVDAVAEMSASQKKEFLKSILK